MQQAATDSTIPTKYAFFTQRHGTGVALQRKRMDISQNPQSATGTLARGHGKALKPEDTDVMWMIDQAQERAASSNGLDNSH